MPNVIHECPRCGGLGTRSDVSPDPDGNVPYWAIRCASCGEAIFRRREERALVVVLGLVAALAAAGWYMTFG